MMAPLGPTPLAGAHVRLEPLAPAHLAPLAEATLGHDLFAHFPYVLSTPDDLARWIDEMLRAQDAGAAVPFVTVDGASGRVAGSTSFLAIDRAHHRAEIGSTWVSPPWQRTAVNTEAKYLMLRHAFETAGANRIEFKTDARNTRSRAALRRIGAREEGIFRNHMVMPDGRLRDSVYFSVIADEWPDVKAALEAKLARRAA